MRRRIRFFLNEAQYNVEFTHTILHNRCLFQPALHNPLVRPATKPSVARGLPGSADSTADSESRTKLRGIEEGSDQKIQACLGKIREGHKEPVPPPQKATGSGRKQEQVRYAHKEQKKVAERHEVDRKKMLDDIEQKRKHTPKLSQPVPVLQEPSPSLEEYKKKPSRNEDKHEEDQRLCEAKIKAQVKELSQYLIAKHTSKDVEEEKQSKDMQHMMDLMQNVPFSRHILGTQRGVSRGFRCRVRAHSEV